MVTHGGKCIRFSETEVKESHRDTKGVKGITLGKDDYVVGVEAFDAEQVAATDKKKGFFEQLLVVTENGLGKRTPIGEYPLQRRSGQGVKVAEVTSKTGPIAAALMVTHNTDQVIITTKTAVAIKLPCKNIPRLQRPTQGVILMRFAKAGDQVAAVTTLDREEE